jgi:DNA-binding transcriptional MerR regulator
VQELPRKSFYKLSEVCRYTDTQPYVLRFWESEFPQLNPDKSASGQRLYRKRDIDLVRRIKELLYDEEYTLDGARKRLAEELAGRRSRKPSRGKGRAAEQAAAPAVAPSPPPKRFSALSAPRKRVNESPAAAPSVETVPRQRYEAAVDEIDHLRLALKEAEKERRRAEGAEQEERERAERAVGHLERLLEILS